MAKLTSKKIQELLTRGVEKIIVKESLEKKLKSEKKLRIKHGVDPTTKDLHLGYAVIYQKLKEFQDLGHQVIFLIGDFTARFGDPTDQRKTRGLRDKKEIEKAAENYIKQIGKILNLKKLEIRRNSEWFDKFTGEDMLKLQSRFTIARMLERDMFQERMKRGEEVFCHEPVYPMLQAYDSVILKSDLTIIGSDQLFNEIQARELQKEYNQEPQDIIAMPLLVGTDGKRKMSQSLGNYIGITEEPFEQYGKIMSIPDDLIFHYFELCTKIPLKEIDQLKKALKAGVNPRDIKARLAQEIVKLYHGSLKAKRAKEEFERIFKKHLEPSKILEYKLSFTRYKLQDLLTKTKLASSKSEARRLIEQGGVKINRRVCKDWQEEIEIKKGMIIQVGKRKFAKLEPSS